MPVPFFSPTFMFMIVFALDSGVVCPLLFDSAFRLAIGAAAGLGLSLLFWWLGTRRVDESIA